MFKDNNYFFNWIKTFIRWFMVYNLQRCITCISLTLYKVVKQLSHMTALFTPSTGVQYLFIIPWCTAAWELWQQRLSHILIMTWNYSIIACFFNNIINHELLMLFLLLILLYIAYRTIWVTTAWYRIILII